MVNTPKGRQPHHGDIPGDGARPQALADTHTGHPHRRDTQGYLGTPGTHATGPPFSAYPSPVAGSPSGIAGPPCWEHPSLGQEVGTPVKDPKGHRGPPWLPSKPTPSGGTPTSSIHTTFIPIHLRHITPPGKDHHPTGHHAPHDHPVSPGTPRLPCAPGTPPGPHHH